MPSRESRSAAISPQSIERRQEAANNRSRLRTNEPPSPAKIPRHEKKKKKKTTPEVSRRRKTAGRSRPCRENPEGEKNADTSRSKRRRQKQLSDQSGPRQSSQPRLSPTPQIGAKASGDRIVHDQIEPTITMAVECQGQSIRSGMVTGTEQR